MCKSPLARILMSSRPCRAIWSSIWSRNGSPVSNFAWPLPSRFSSTVIWVSSVLRETFALRMIFALCELVKGILQCRHKLRAFVGRTDRHAQAVIQHRVSAVQILDQHAASLQAIKHFCRMRHAEQQEIRLAGVNPHCGDFA